ncbi:MAG: hypothetical protein ABI407_04380 [Bradyrhizobium sp.]
MADEPGGRWFPHWDGESAIDVVGYGVQIAAQLGARIIKVKLPTAHIEQEVARKVYDERRIPIVTAAECKSAWGPDADRHGKSLIHLTLEGACFGAYLQCDHDDPQCHALRAEASDQRLKVREDAVVESGLQRNGQGRALSCSFDHCVCGASWPYMRSRHTRTCPSPLAETDMQRHLS